MAKRLTELRKKWGLAQKGSGVSGDYQSAYGFYEQNRREPSPEVIRKLADFLACPQITCWGGLIAKIELHQSPGLIDKGSLR